MVDAERAERIGLVSAVYPQEALLDQAKVFLRGITKNGPIAVSYGFGVHLPGPECGTGGRRELRIRTFWITRFHGRHERGTDGLSREAKGGLQGRMR